MTNKKIFDTFKQRLYSLTEPEENFPTKLFLSNRKTLIRYNVGKTILNNSSLSPRKMCVKKVSERKAAFTGRHEANY
jgi:hypothetical protein